ncbi:YlxM family DNA-binding protein [Paenibacillus sp. y28]|uniref:YlxM family DNA-binding protein n=1 Tax=Paenibacillus sp. y28 TaxID=3129110 RepID=UPI0030178DCE
MDELSKTYRISMLIDFYDQLLTEKQRTFVRHYFHEDFSLGELSEMFQISRQAVNEHIKRAQQTLEDYEAKLQLLAKHEERAACMKQLEALLDGVPEQTKLQMSECMKRIVEI